MTRRILLVPGILVPLGLIWSAKAMASWRPVKVAQFSSGKDEDVTISSPSAHTVFLKTRKGTDSVETICTLLDTETGKTKKWTLPGVQAAGMQKGFFWRIQSFRPLGFTLEIEGPDGQKKFFTGRHNFYSPLSPRVHIFPEKNLIFVGEWSYFTAWNLKTRRFIKEIDVKGGRKTEAKFASDGETFISVQPTELVQVNTTTGHVVKRTPFLSGKKVVSLFEDGRLALIVEFAPSTQISVVDTQTGQTLWKRSGTSAVFDFIGATDNEKLVFLRTGSNEYEACELKTGKLVRHFTTVQSSTYYSICLAPDGSAIYYVLDGTLYKQRAF